MSFIVAFSRGHAPVLTRFLVGASLSSLSLLLLSCGGGRGEGASPVGVVVAPVALAASPGISLLAGGLGGSGNVDGTGTAGRLSSPLGIVVDSTGNLYVADTSNQLVRKVTPAGVMTTLAGAAGKAGSVDGLASTARFNSPYGLALDSADNLYVADTGNFTIRKITPAGNVTTVAGVAGSAGFADGNGVSARLSAPVGLAVDAADNVYVTDVVSNTVRKITPAGDVSTLAGLAGVEGVDNGTGSAARFKHPVGIVFDGVGSFYVADSGNQVIRKISLAGEVGTVAGTAGRAGSTDGWAVGTALFNVPVGIALDAGNLYVTEVGSHTVRMITPAGLVSTLAGGAGTTGSTDGAGTVARFNAPVGIAIDGLGSAYISDTNNNAIRKISLTTAGVSTFTGLVAATGAVDAAGASARFSAPSGIEVDLDGYINVADTDNNTIRRITPAGAVTTLAGVAGAFGSGDGAVSVARFKTPLGIASDIFGNRYIADAGNYTVRKISTAGAVTTLAGNAGFFGAVDGSGGVARFNAPAGIVVDTAGYVYVTDSSSHTIRKITPDGVVTTVAGLAGVAGNVDGTGTLARFNSPTGIALDLAGNIYVADTANHTVRKITPAGVVSTLAGKAGSAGALDDTGTAALFSAPFGVAVDADNNVYVADTGNSLLRKVTPAGVVTTLAGVAGSNGVVLGNLPGSLNTPVGLAIGFDGSLYTISENAVVRVELPTPINRFGVSLQATATSISLGQSYSLNWNSPNASSCVASEAWSGSKPGSGSEVITPSAGGVATFALECTESGTGTIKSASVTVTTVVPVPKVTLAASATNIAPGESFTLDWSSTNATACVASDSWTGSLASSGSKTVTPVAGTYTYTLTCSGDGGSSSVSVTVKVPPVVAFGVSSPIISLGQNTSLTWSSINATSCVASGAWTGSQHLDGTLVIVPSAGNQTYTLTCTGPGGIDNKSVTVTVLQSGTSSALAGGSGGAAGADVLLGLGLLGLVRRYYTRPRQ